MKPSSKRVLIDVGRDFSRYPGGRLNSKGPYSGERFRNQLLLKHLNEGALLEIVLDGTSGFGSSFLDEAFGGLVRNGFSASTLRKQIVFISEDQYLVDEIWTYVDDAEKKKPKA
jgi:hypothetical protein